MKRRKFAGIGILIVVALILVAFSPVLAKNDSRSQNEKTMIRQPELKQIVQLKVEEQPTLVAVSEDVTLEEDHFAMANITDEAEVYVEPDTDSDLAGVIFATTTMEAFENVNGFVHIRTGNLDGYVLASNVLLGHRGRVLENAKCMDSEPQAGMTVAEVQAAYEEAMAAEAAYYEEQQAEAEEVDATPSYFAAGNANTGSAYGWGGAVLNRIVGVVEGPSGKETYYNLPMGGVIKNLQNAGIEGEYWVRDDGVKMYGEYVMIAADYSSRPIGTLVETSLGMGIVCDTGSFAATNPTQVDIATAW